MKEINWGSCNPFENGTDEAKKVLYWCAVCLHQNIKSWNGTYEYIGDDVTMHDVCPLTIYPMWINTEATGLEVVRYAELCVQYLRIYDKSVFYYSDGADPKLLLLTEMERMQKRDLQIGLALKNADTSEIRKIVKVIKSCALEFYHSVENKVDLRDELVAIEFMLSAVKIAMLSHQTQNRSAYK